MTDYSWHEDFYTRKVFPQICKDAGECNGFFAWLQIGDLQLYHEIIRLEQKINEIWLAAGDREQFRGACRDWYAACLSGIEKWRKAMREPPPNPRVPEQVRLI